MSAGTLVAPSELAGTARTDVPSSQAVTRRRQANRLSRKSRKPAHPAVGYIVHVLQAVALLAVWLLLYAFVFSAVSEQRTQAVKYHDLRAALAGETAPITEPIATGLPMGLLNVPVIGLRNAVVLEGTSSEVTRQGPGHLRSTVLPGQPGVSVLMGRSLLYGAPFGSLTSLKAGDLIAATTGQGVFNFTVVDVRRVGDPLPDPVKAGGSRLVLETSSGSGITPDSELFVDADLTGKVAAAGTTVPAGAEEAAMQGSTGQLSTLLLWIEGLLLVSLATVWLRHRWGRWQSWLIGLPAVLALVWGATSSVALLLPNLL